MGKGLIDFPRNGNVLASEQILLSASVFFVLLVMPHLDLEQYTTQPRVELLSSTNEDCHTAPDFLIKLG